MNKNRKLNIFKTLLVIFSNYFLFCCTNLITKYSALQPVISPPTYILQGLVLFIGMSKKTSVVTKFIVRFR